MRRPLLILIVILLIGWIPRATMLTGAGHVNDLGDFYRWTLCSAEYKLFGLYHCDTIVNHAPIGPVLQAISLSAYRAAGGDPLDVKLFDLPRGSKVYVPRMRVAFAEHPALVAALKLPALIFEMALISLVFYIAYQQAGTGWAALAAVLLSFNPGWMAVTAWWGQTDSIFVFFLLLTAYLLTRNRPRWAWVAYSLAWLTKFQSIIVFPLLLALSVRRYGFRKTVEGLAIFALIVGVVTLPFFLSAHFDALIPYLNVDRFPQTSVNAFNFWYWLIGGWLPDDLPLLGSITFYQIGIGLLGIATALLCLRAWLVRDRDDDLLLWATACFSFFILPTQIHERYLYPAVVFLVLALVRDRRLLLIYVAAALAFSANILAFAEPGNPLLDLFARVLAWSPQNWAAVLTIHYVVLFLLMLQPLLARRGSRSGTSYPGQ